MSDLLRMQNAHWKVGILPQVGAGIAFGRVRYSGNWLDVIRPTASEDYGNSSKHGSFIMLPWANRIGEGKLRVGEQEYLLQTTDDGTARHGDVRKRPWQVVNADETRIQLSFDSTDFTDINFPYNFIAEAIFSLDSDTFVWELSLTNTDDKSFPAGFGHHPYFVRTANSPLIEIPVKKEFKLTHELATDTPESISQDADFRSLRGLVDGVQLDNLLTERDMEKPVRIVYPQWQTELNMQADPIFKQILIYTDVHSPSVAIEPQTNANDGFNLHLRDIKEAGIFTLQPDEIASGTVRLSVHPYEG